MTIFILILLSVLSLSSSASLNFGELCKDTQRDISEYLECPNVVFGAINTFTRGRQYPLKYFVNKHFDIPELEKIDPNEPELEYLLKLSWFAKNSFHFFQALTEDVVNGKKPYNVLYGPLLSYLARKFKELSAQQQEIVLSNYFETFEYRLFRYYCLKKDYKSGFEVIMNSPNEIISWFYDEDDDADIYEMFKENPQFAEVLKSIMAGPDDHNNAFMSTQHVKQRWVFRCILHDAPESYYIDLLAQEHDLISKVLKKDDFLSVEISEAEFGRVHSQFKRLYNQFFITDDQQQVIFYNLLIDIRYAPETPQDIDFSVFTDDQILKLAQMALLGKKKDLFLFIYNSYANLFNDNLDKFYNCKTVEKIAFVFEILNCSPEEVKVKILSDAKFLQIVLKYYAIRNIKIDNNLATIDLVAPESSLAHNFPHFLQFNIQFTSHLFENFVMSVASPKGPNNFWSSMRVIDEETFYSFLNDYEKLSFARSSVKASNEVIKFILNSPLLIQKIKTIGIIFTVNDKFLELMNSIENAKELNEIFDLKNISADFITRLKSGKELRNFEILTGKSVAQHYLDQDRGSLTENDYFKWRFAFNYWMKGGHKFLIAVIKSMAIVEMLRIDHYDEMLFS